jgi:protein required for attachment to host cells
MYVQHGAHVLVTDGSKGLYLSNEGDGDFPDFHLIRKWERHVSSDHELRSAGPGHAFSSNDRGTRRSTYEETDLHEQAKVEFTSSIARFLNDQVQSGSIEELIIVAPPRALGLLRRKLRREVKDLITAEVDSDLVRHPIGMIEQLLSTQPVIRAPSLEGTGR